MPNPFLPLNEYVPDGEPRVFGERVYIYGSHDIAGSDRFCDDRLKVWSAPVTDLDRWVCHGDIFRVEKGELYAPDVVEKGGKYYLYAYINGEKGQVAVSERPEGPFTFFSHYKHESGQGDGGLFIDPGVLVDDDGKVYVYCGFKKSFMVRLNPYNMCEVVDYKEDIIPAEKPFDFFEACSPRKIGDVYYLIYSQNPPNCGKLVYATSDSPFGPFVYGGVIIDNGEDYPGGNNHGSICEINGQWYVFYHRMTNGTIMSRRACAERIEISPYGKISRVEMTSLGFEKSLNPYAITPAETACVLTGGAFITERNVFERYVTDITDGCVIGYKYFGFGEDFGGGSMSFFANIRGTGCKAGIRVLIDDPVNGEEIGVVETGADDGVYRAKVKAVTGTHSLYLVAESRFGGDFKHMFGGRRLFGLISFVFVK